MLGIDLEGKHALVAGVSDDTGYGFGIAKALGEAGAKVSVASWPPALGIFEKLLKRGKIDSSLALSDGRKLEFEAIYPLDAQYDTDADVPEEIRSNKRYQGRGDFSIEGLASRLREEHGEPCLDIVVHSLANSPEVQNPLLETSRNGYLTAMGTSAYSFVSMVQRLGPLMRPGGSFLALSYLAAERVIPGYGGGMSSAKAALEGDTRTLAFEAGRKWGHRVNAISAGPYASRAASAIGFISKMIRFYGHASPLTEPLDAREVGHTAAFLCSPLASGVTGTVMHVDKGYHAMGVPADVEGIVDALEGSGAHSSSSAE
jgi:enoyl-[acyl-carrier protein] reductase I